LFFKSFLLELLAVMRCLSFPSHLCGGETKNEKNFSSSLSEKNNQQRNDVFKQKKIFFCVCFSSFSVILLLFSFLFFQKKTLLPFSPFC